MTKQEASERQEALQRLGTRLLTDIRFWIFITGFALGIAVRSLFA